MEIRHKRWRMTNEHFFSLLKLCHIKSNQIISWFNSCFKLMQKNLHWYACCLWFPQIKYLNKLQTVCLQIFSEFIVLLFWINSFSPSAVNVCQWYGSALVQVIAYRLFGAKPLPESMLLYFQLDKFQWNSNWHSIIFIQENAFEIVVCQNGSHFVQREMS